MSLDRLKSWIPNDHILVAAPAELSGALRAQAPELSEAAFLPEPSPKGTAAVIGLSALRIAQADPQAVMICLTADHFIGNAERLQLVLQAATEACATGDLVTLGIRPLAPDTGYGYIERGERVGAVRGVDVHRVEAFKEKPDRLVAETYVADGRHVWNSGMFVWRVDSLLSAIRRCMPELHAALDRIRVAWGTNREADVLAEVWPAIAPATIDVGLMERADNVIVLDAGDLRWADVGSWDRLYELRAPDADGNVLDTPAGLAVDSRRTLVISTGRDRGARAKLIALLGVEDLIVIDTPDALLVCPRHRAADVREVVARLKESGLEPYLAWES
jgi:mannose-1-phosphate guanylyltransferase